MFDSLRPHGLRHTRLRCPSPNPGAYPTHVRWVGDAIRVGVLPWDFSRVRLRLGPVGQHWDACFWGPQGIMIFLSCGRGAQGFSSPRSNFMAGELEVPGLQGKLSDQGQFSGPAFGPPRSRGSLYFRDTVSSQPRGSLGEATSGHSWELDCGQRKGYEWALSLVSSH